MSEDADQGTAQRILDAAITVIERDGFASATTRSIAEEAQVNLALINYYYRSKDALFLTAMRMAWGNADKDLEGFAKGGAGSAMDRLEAMVDYLVEGISKFPNLTRAMLELGPDTLLPGEPPLSRINAFAVRAVDAVLKEAGLDSESPGSFKAAFLTSAIMYPLFASRTFSGSFGFSLNSAQDREVYASRLVSAFRASLCSPP